jgi:UV DNA damage endonuclease
MHPGQYTILNSPKKDVVEKSILDLNFHCKFLDSLNLPPSHKIILHVGGVYGDKKSAMDRFITQYNNLDSNIKKRLIIENDERFFSIYDLLEINSLCNVPIIFDNLHYKCYGDLSMSIPELIPLIKKTWKKEDGDMKVHYSIQDPFKKRGSHSPTIFIDKFFNYLKNSDFSNIDIMLEVKDKEVSAIKTINSINFINNKFSDIEFLKEIKSYKLFVLEKSDYQGISKLKDIKSQNNFLKLYNFIDSLIYKEYNEVYFRRALNNSFESIRNELNSKEINHYNKNYKEQSYLKCKEYLKKLSDKYNLPLNNSYYFIY